MTLCLKRARTQSQVKNVVGDYLGQSVPRDKSRQLSRDLNIPEDKRSREEMKFRALGEKLPRGISLTVEREKNLQPRV